jgi:NADH-quinone oxidoreductase subunit F
MLVRIEEGKGEPRDIDTLNQICDSIGGKTLCPFGDAAITPVLSTIAKFRDEYVYYIENKGSWRRKAKTFAKAVLSSEPTLIGAGAR